MAILSFPKNPSNSAERLPHNPSPANQPSGLVEPLRAATAPLLPDGISILVLFRAAVVGASILVAAPPVVAQGLPPTRTAAPAAPGGSSPAAAVNGQKLLNRPTAPAEWTVTFRYGSKVAPEQAAHRPNLVKVTLLEKEGLETIHYPERITEVWRAEGHVFLSETGSEHASIRVGQSVENLGGLGINAEQAADATRGKNGQITETLNGVVLTTSVALEEPDWVEFKEFNWVTAELLRGKIEIGGEKLLVYAELESEDQTPPPGSGAGAAGGKGRAPAPGQAAPKYPAGPLGGIPLKPGIRVAAIEESTKTPRYLQLGENIQVYAFGKPQQTKLALPEKITSLVVKPAPPPQGAKPVSLIP